jgi:hypothetical protein
LGYYLSYEEEKEYNTIQYNTIEVLNLPSLYQLPGGILAADYFMGWCVPFAPRFYPANYLQQLRKLQSAQRMSNILLL